MINMQLELKLSNGQIVKASCDWSSKNVPEFGKNFYTNIRFEYDLFINHDFFTYLKHHDSTNEIFNELEKRKIVSIHLAAVAPANNRECEYEKLINSKDFIDATRQFKRISQHFGIKSYTTASGEVVDLYELELRSQLQQAMLRYNKTASSGAMPKDSLIVPLIKEMRMIGEIDDDNN